MKRQFFFSLLLVLLLLAWGPASPRLTRLPYLQEMTSHSVLIAWRTSSALPGGVTVKLHSANKREKENIVWDNHASENHVVSIQHLAPGATYWYRIVEKEEKGPNQLLPMSDWLWFKTFPEGKSAGFSFAVLGDSGSGSDYQKKISHEIFIQHPDLVIHAGDVIYGGKSDSDFNEKFFSIYAQIAENAPFFPSLGNHDVETQNGEPYLENFYLPQDSPGKGRYYSFDCGQVHFVALDSNEPLVKGSEQHDWLLRDLKETPLPVKIVYFHHPVYSSGYHGSTPVLRKNLEPVFKRFHVVLVFNGHDHDYERTVPIHGTTYIVTGGGGGLVYPVGNSSWTAFSATAYNFVLCKVNGKVIHLEAIDDTGKVFDKADISYMGK